jgi:phospholipid/cholesterol/gamma-HCH transport system substrate-binding protein
MNDPIKNILIGLFVFAAGILIVFMILFLHPTAGDDSQKIRVRFANIDKVSVGTRVTYGGKPVGEVIDIKDVEDPENARKEGKDGFVYLYELELLVDSKVRTYNTDQISLRTSGLLGEKSVEITPQPPKPGQKLRLIQDEIIFADQSGSVEETFKEFKELSDKIEGTLDSLKFAIDDLNKRQIWEKIADTAENLRQITDSLNKPEQWTAMIDNAEEITKSLKGSAGKLGQTIDNTVAITDHIKRGKGTIGELVMNDDLYLRTTSIMSKGETVVDDISHYGLLYQNDKRWQKVRARRANLITRLSCPQEFRNYFNDELDEITAAMGRISMVIQDTEYQECCGCFYEDYEFRKVFAELMRRVKMMEESLKLYSQQVVDCDVMQTELYLERN